MSLARNPQSWGMSSSGLLVVMAVPSVSLVVLGSVCLRQVAIHDCESVVVERAFLKHDLVSCPFGSVSNALQIEMVLRAPVCAS